MPSFLFDARESAKTDLTARCAGPVNIIPGVFSAEQPCHFAPEGVAESRKLECELLSEQVVLGARVTHKDHVPIRSIDLYRAATPLVTIRRMVNRHRNLINSTLFRKYASVGSGLAFSPLP